MPEVSAFSHEMNPNDFSSDILMKVKSGNIHQQYSHPENSYSEANHSKSPSKSVSGASNIGARHQKKTKLEVPTVSAFKF